VQVIKKSTAIGKRHRNAGVTERFIPKGWTGWKAQNGPEIRSSIAGILAARRAIAKKTTDHIEQRRLYKCCDGIIPALRIKAVLADGSVKVITRPHLLS
jgi:hypothetical protein